MMEKVLYVLTHFALLIKGWIDLAWPRSAIHRETHRAESRRSSQRLPACRSAPGNNLRRRSSVDEDRGDVPVALEGLGYREVG